MGKLTEAEIDAISYYAWIAEGCLYADELEYAKIVLESKLGDNQWES